MTCLLLAIITFAWGPTVAENDPRIEDFLGHVSRSAEYAPAARDFVLQAWQDADRDAQRPFSYGTEDFIIEALAVLSPDFDEALALLESGDRLQAMNAFRDLAESSDPYLATNARVLRLRAAVQGEYLDQALRVAEELALQREQRSAFTLQEAQSQYLLGYVRLRNQQYEGARQAFAEMLARHPDAPESLRRMATDLLENLDARQPGGLPDVADLMNWSGMALGHARVDEAVIKKQQEALWLLDALVARAEKQEQQSQQSQPQPGGNQTPGQGIPEGNQQPMSPADKSILPQGAGGQEKLRAAQRATPGQVWGSMPPRAREEILQPIQEHFPGRYRALVEQYYRELSQEQ